MSRSSCWLTIANVPSRTIAVSTSTRVAGFASLAISCAEKDGYVPGYHLPSDTPSRVDPDAMERAHGFALELIRQLDRDLGRRDS